MGWKSSGKNGDARMRFTIFGSTGFIGRNLKEYLINQGHEVITPNRDDIEHISNDEDLGHVIYAIGMTGDFRTRLNDTVESQVSVFNKLLGNIKYQSVLYLSSTRVYSGLDNDSLVNEETSLKITPSLDAVYNGSKILGESLCMGIDNPYVRAVRLSNVYGADQSLETFLGSVLSDAVKNGEVTIQGSQHSCKDYISINDVLPIIENIALHGQHKIYNLGSGINTTHRVIADCLTKQGYKVNFKPEGFISKFPKIGIDRIRQEFNFKPSSITEDIDILIKNIKKDNKNDKSKPSPRP